MRRSRYASSTRRLTRTHAARRFEDEDALQQAWRQYKRTGDRVLRNRLVEHYLYLVRYIAQRLRAKLPDEVDVDDLMSAGIFGLLDAIEAFDLERGVKFETYCSQRIRGAILDELRSMDWVPRLVRQRAHQLDEAVRALEAELGRMPTEDEIARRLNLTPAQLEKLLRDASATHVVSLSTTLPDDGNAGRETSEIDVVPDERSIDPIAEAQKQDIKDFIRERLSREEQLVLVLYYFEQMTMKEIGATLDLSESRVSQMHSAIVQRLRRELGVEEAALRQTDVFA